MKNRLSDYIDRVYFEELSRENPEDVCRRTSCRYDAVKGIYRLSAWGDEYEIHPKEGKIDCSGDREDRPHSFFPLFIIYYLLRSKNPVPCGQWISEKDLPGGATFFRGPHEIPVRLISDRFGNDIEAFRNRCVALHGTAIDMADVAYRFDIMPNIPVAVLYWTGDDEFAAEAKIMYDRTIRDELPLDIVFVLAVGICSRLSANA